MAQIRTVHSMLAALVVGACSSGSPDDSGSGGSAGTGATTSGSSGTAGLTGTGGSSGAGGAQSTGGATAAGGTGQSGVGGSGAAVGGGGPQGGSGGIPPAGAGGTTGPGGSGGTAGASGQGGDGGGGMAGAGGSGQGGSSAGAGGGSGVGGSSAGAGGGSGGAAPDGNEPVPSAGCGKTRTLQNGTINITYGNAARKYILRVPDSYDNSHPYRLVLAYAWSGGSAQQVVSTNYFTHATLDGTNTIFAAPDAADGSGTWSSDDVALTDAILAQIEGDLCIDTTRIFATGFSFGGGMAMALACTRADVFRAVAFFSGADLTGSCPSTLTKPIAYYASQASEDAGGLPTTSPITGEYKQAEFAALNGCTAVPSSTTFPAAGQPHTCTIYQNCSAGHPTEYCVFNGAHGWEPKDPGQSASWNAPEAWKFITQF